MPSTEKIAVVALCEPGEFEWQAVLLMSSVLAFLQDEILPLVYCRRALLPLIHSRTRAFFDDHGIAFHPIDPDFKENYPEGNKLYACAMPRDVSRTLFLDTDLMVVQPTNAQEIFRPAHVSGRVTSDWMWGRTADAWRPVYADFGLRVPRMRLLRKRGEEMALVPLSLNAGVVAFEDARFGKLWLETALRIESGGLVADPYPTLDQIALPIAAARAEMPLHLLDPIWNAPDRMMQRRPGAVKFFHYRRLKFLLPSPAQAIANVLIREFTAFDSLAEMVAFYEDQGATSPLVKYFPG
ncbi:MAG: hypothetical protein AAF689_13535 [Pseudomonadota bacterium]